MEDSAVYTDDYERSFSSLGDFLGFLRARQDNSSWQRIGSRTISFTAAVKGTPEGEAWMAIFAQNGKLDILADTMEHTGLIMEVDGAQIPVRYCALKTILERARISGYALSKMSRTRFAEVLNYCMDVASGDSLIKVADGKVSAVHGGDPKDYSVMEMLPLFRCVADHVDSHFPGSHFVTAHYDHSIATAIWRLDGQTDLLLDTYRREVSAKGLDPDSIIPALKFATSDVGMSGANLYPIFLTGNGDRIVPLGYPIKTEHKNGADIEYFKQQLSLLYARFTEVVEKQMRLLNIDIRYPANTLLGVLKKIGAPKKASFEVLDYFLAEHGDSPCTAYELFMQMGDIIFFAQCEGATGTRIA